MSDRRRLLVLAALAATLTLGAAPARADFDAVVRTIESRYRVHATRIPFLGLVRFAVWIVHPNGVSDVQLATFEHATFGDGADLGDIVRREAGEPLQPVVQSHSRRSGETTQIYARPLGTDRVAMFILAHERDETTVLRVVMSMNEFQNAVHRPQHVVASVR